MYSAVLRRSIQRSSITWNTRPFLKTSIVPSLSRSFRNFAPSKASPSPTPKVMHQAEAFLNGPSASYIEEMYVAWLQNPAAVHISWQVYFRNMLSEGNYPSFMPPPNLIPSSASTISYEGAESPSEIENMLPAYIPADEILEHMKVQLLVRAYQVRGHHLARIDPLEISNSDMSNAPELDYTHYGFKESDLDRRFYLGSGILPGFLAQEGERNMTLRDVIDRLKKTYCNVFLGGSIGIEYGHIPDRIQCDWLRQNFEVPVRYQYSKEKKTVILDRLLWSDSFERFVATKYPTEKRFGVEGCEALIPGMKALIDSSVELGVNSVVMGMPHRGRLNVLSNVVRKPNASIFSEFAGSSSNDEWSGDVKYHLGMNYVRPTPSGKIVHLSLAANPSHLEAVNPVVSGKVRGIQFYQNDEVERGKAMAVLLHGDAAFSGQGVVYETLGFSDLPSYTTGGTIHIVVNNQIGFTTDPRFSRSTPYCSDVAKTVSAPILHVNGDDVEAVIYSMELAADWRAKFKKDVVIDIICYRKYGHNEIDQPQFTQPLMYQRIEKMTPVAEKYIKQLIEEGTFNQEEIDAMKSRIWQILEESYLSSKDYEPSPKEWVSSSWPGRNNFIVAAMILKKYRFETVTKNVRHAPGLTLRPNELKMRISKRDNLPLANSIPKPVIEAKAAVRHAIPVATIPLPSLEILFGSNTGSAQDFATVIASASKVAGFTNVILTKLNSWKGFERLTSTQSEKPYVVVVTSTYNGQPPENADKFAKNLLELQTSALASDTFPFDGINFTVFGCGNKQWRTYQSFPTTIDAVFENLGARRFFPRGEGNADEDMDTDFQNWFNQLIAFVSDKFGANTTAPARLTGAPELITEGVEIKFIPFDSSEYEAALKKENSNVESLSASIVELRELQNVANS
ncbi:2-oxoglutarate dehydrogenase E1 component, partial [Nowakowskiella sp. JEL0078]